MASAANRPLPRAQSGLGPRLLICRQTRPCRLTLPMHVFIVVTERYVVLVDTLINAFPAEARSTSPAHTWQAANCSSPPPTPIPTMPGATSTRRAAQPRSLPSSARAAAPHAYVPPRSSRPSRTEGRAARRIRRRAPRPAVHPSDDVLVIDGGDRRSNSSPPCPRPTTAPSAPEIACFSPGRSRAAFAVCGRRRVMRPARSLKRLAAGAARPYCHARRRRPNLIRANLAYFDRLPSRAALASGARPTRDGRRS